MRTPRPKGTTEISYIYNKDKTEDNKHKLITHVIRHYINTNFCYCNQSMNLEQFSQYIQVEPNIIHKEIMDIGQIQYQMLNDKAKEEIFGGLIFNCFFGALSDRSTALQHSNILLAAQGQTYKPFISSEVTKALKLNQDANAQVLNVLTKFIGNQGPGISITNNINANSNNNNQVLTVEGALQLIQQNTDNRPLLEDPEAKEALYIQYGIGSMPEVNANLQTGYDTSKEGLSFNKIADAQLIDDEEGKRSRHADRREKAYNIDTEADEV